MKKTIKIVSVSVLVAIILGSVGFNVYIMFNTYKGNLIMQGAKNQVDAMWKQVKDGQAITMDIDGGKMICANQDKLPKEQTQPTQ